MDLILFYFSFILFYYLLKFLFFSFYFWLKIKVWCNVMCDEGIIPVTWLSHMSLSLSLSHNQITQRRS